MKVRLGDVSGQEGRQMKVGASGVDVSLGDDGREEEAQEKKKK